MNILFVDQFGELGGGQLCLIDLMPAIIERGWNPVAAVPPEGGLAERLSQLGAAIEPFSPGVYTPKRKTASDAARYLRLIPGLASQLRDLIAKHRITLIYANGPRILPAAAYAAKRSRVALVFHVHSYLPQGPSRSVVHAALRLVPDTRVIAVSRFAASYLSLKTQVEIIPNGVPDLRTHQPLANQPVERQPPANEPPANQQPANQLPVREPVRAATAGSGRRPTIALVGRIAPEKGHLDFVEAARLLPREWNFLVVGAPTLSTAGYLNQVQEQARDLPIQFLGWREDLSEVYNQITVLAVPSAEDEASGRVILEAFSAGVPVVAYDSGGIPELIRDGVNGYLVRERTPQALAAKIRSLVEGPASACRVTEQARDDWRVNYTLAHYQERVTNLIAPR